MTDPSDPSDSRGGHLGLDRLADLAEGLLDADEAAGAREHLAGCAVCRTEATALAELPAGLAALGAEPAPMPADVAAALDDALAAEAGRSHLPTSSVTVVPSLDARRAGRTRRGTQLLQVAAVLVVLLGLVGVGYTLTTAGGGADSGSTAAGGDAAAEDDAGVAGEASGAGGSAGPRVVRSGTDYRQGSLGEALAAVTAPAGRNGSRAPGLASQPSTAEPSSPSAPGPKGVLSASPSPEGALDGAAALADPAALGACLDRLGLVGAPLGVDLATYQGKPAAVVVLPSEGDPTHVDVYAIAPSCPAGDFLAFARVPRP
jgi:hypothetical protein